MKRFHLTTLATLTVLALVPSVAGGQSTLPPDNSGVDQYTEGVPGAGGDKPASKNPPSNGGSSGGGGSSNAGSLPASVIADLEALGGDGAAAAALAEAGAGTTGEGKAQPTRAGGTPVQGKSSSNRGEDGGTGSSVGQVVGDLLGGSDSGGMGLALPLILLAALAALVGVALRRRRGGAQGPGQSVE